MKHFSLVSECSRKGQHMTKDFPVRSQRTTDPFPRLEVEGDGAWEGTARSPWEWNTALIPCTSV